MPAMRRHGAISSRNTPKLAANLVVIACGGLLLSGAPSALAQPRSATLTIECETDGSSAHYQEALIGSGATMGRNTTSSTGCPNHVNYAINPNAAVHTASEVTVPAFPMLIDSALSVTDLSEKGGAVGIMFNGVALFSAWAGGGAAVSYETSAISLEGDTFDLCGGHATGDGIYHYHNTAGCLQEQAMLNAETTSADHSPQLGWSYDGFPIYGQLGPDGVEMLMCEQTGADAIYCLDSCNGYEGALDGVDDFMYRYYGSCGFDESFFPFTTNCYRGCCPDGVTCGQHMEACGSAAIDGSTTNYTPEVVDRGLDQVYESVLIDGDDTDMIDTDNSMDCSNFLGSFGSASTTVTPSPTPAQGGGGRGNSSATPAPSSLPEASTQAPGRGGPGRVPSTPAPSMAPQEEASTSGPTPSPTSASRDGGPNARTSAPSMTTEEPLTNEPTPSPTPASGDSVVDTPSPSTMAEEPLTNDPTPSPTPASGDTVVDTGSPIAEGSAPANDEETSGGGRTYRSYGLAFTVLAAASTVFLIAEFLQ